MNTLNKTLIALATGAVLTTSAAHATGGQPYVGAKIGQFNVDVDSKADADNATAYGVYAGYSFDHHFGAEAEYLTSSDADYTYAGGREGEYNMDTAGIYGTYHYHFPAYTPLYVKGKLGLAQTSIERDDGRDADDSGLAGGVALGYNLGTTAAIEAEYTKLPSIEDVDDMPDYDADLWTIGAHYRF